jgi:hypothetical protein
MPEIQLLIIIFAVYFLAGLIKGVIGMGLPLVTVGLLTAIIGLQPAIALMLAPAFLTNIWQGFSGEYTKILLKRFWTLFVLTMLFTWPGTIALAHFNVDYLSGLLGVSLVFYTALNLSRLKIHVPQRWESKLNPLVGAISGILAGMTGAFTVPGVIYMQSTQLKREELVQGMGILFTLSAIGLSISMGTQNLLTSELSLVSFGAVAPTFIGMIIGTRIRKRTSEQSFRLSFLIALGVLGVYIVTRSAISLM